VAEPDRRHLAANLPGGVTRLVTRLVVPRFAEKSIFALRKYLRAPPDCGSISTDHRNAINIIASFLYAGADDVF
jgi:hypothetical protein